MLEVTVIYALPDQQHQVPLEVPDGTTAWQAVELSGLLQQFPEIDPETVRVGIYARLLDGRGNPTAEQYQLANHDRVELYRPLIIDPKEARLLRAKRAKKVTARRSTEKS
ncbi:RnfH family protein [Pseudohongiella sp. SYSU M77423]|uniref:RnfH family protein n=1 Tax=Pseudohongiella sp. SYSU M77423 TaxID=3042312 RepID=UPI002480C205|nr:RnfH family protein [Pseudohongiella sp. SYSU M77423]MDH7944061.1 RnfH family protein [Pseudohongiella sp. SYSU M77423]